MKLITMTPTDKTQYEELGGDQWFAVAENEHDRDMLRLVVDCIQTADNLVSERKDKDAGDFYYGKAAGILIALVGVDWGGVYRFLDTASEHCPEIGETFALDGITFERIK